MRGNSVDLLDSNMLPSQCGVAFDEYVQSVLPPLQIKNYMTNSFRTVKEDLWIGRRLKFLKHINGQWRVGRIKEWYQSYLMLIPGTTTWKVTITLDEQIDDENGENKKEEEEENNNKKNHKFHKGDIVEIHGLVGAKQHNDQMAKVYQYIEETDRYEVRYKRLFKPVVSIGVKETNLNLKYRQNKLEMTCVIHRCNVVGGGTLARPQFNEYDDDHYQHYNDDDYTPQEKFISFHWLDEPSPQIDPNYGSLQANCPTCRAVGPSNQKHNNCNSMKSCNNNNGNDNDNDNDNDDDDDDVEEEKKKEKDECPICLNNDKKCIILPCSHLICSSCWESWCICSSTGGDDDNDGEVPSWKVQFYKDHIEDPEDILRRRTELLDEIMDRGIVPTMFSGPDVDDNGKEIQTEKRKKFDKYVSAFVKVMIAKSKIGGRDGLRDFRATLMERPIFLWENRVACDIINKECTVAALEIIVDVLESRMKTNCIKNELIRIWQAEGLPKDCSNEEEALTRFNPHRLESNYVARYCDDVGRKYEDVKNYRAAISWHNRSLYHFANVGNKSTYNLAVRYESLGITHEKCGFLQTALKFYKKASEIDPTYRYAKPKEERLLNEMLHWKGTANVMPPEEDSPVELLPTEL